MFSESAEKEAARDPLGQVRSIVDATVDLHAENGDFTPARWPMFSD